MPIPESGLLENVEDLEALLDATADWAEGDPDLRLPRALGHKAANAVGTIRLAWSGARSNIVCGPHGQPLTPLAVIWLPDATVTALAAAARALARLIVEGEYPSVAAAIDHYRLYWYCPPNDMLADTAAYLSAVSNQVGDADHHSLIDRLDDVDHTAAGTCHAPVRISQTELAAHQRIVEQLTAIADAPFPTPTHARGEGGDDAER